MILIYNDIHKIDGFQIEMVNTTTDEIYVTIPIAYYEDVKFEIGDAVMLVYENNTK